MECVVGARGGIAESGKLGATAWLTFLPALVYSVEAFVFAFPQKPKNVSRPGEFIVAKQFLMF